VEYFVRILQQAADQLARLDKTVARRIANRIRWLANNINAIAPETLKGDLAGLYKLRVGDYRVLHELLHAERTIVIHFVGHRREAYKRGRSV
jgi:mRNA interferase RelE/StbE